jgi:hypothetical protein
MRVQDSRSLCRRKRRLLVGQLLIGEVLAQEPIRNVCQKRNKTEGGEEGLLKRGKVNSHTSSFGALSRVCNNLTEVYSLVSFKEAKCIQNGTCPEDEEEIEDCILHEFHPCGLILMKWWSLELKTKYHMNRDPLMANFRCNFAQCEVHCYPSIYLSNRPDNRLEFRRRRRYKCSQLPDM